jgi:hypothetical protein
MDWREWEMRPEPNSALMRIFTGKKWKPALKAVRKATDEEDDLPKRKPKRRHQPPEPADGMMHQHNLRAPEGPMDKLLKSLSRMSEAEFTAIVTRYAKGAHPELSESRAFAKVFESNVAIRKAWQIAKGSDVSFGPPRLAQAVGTQVMDQMGVPAMFPPRQFATNDYEVDENEPLSAEDEEDLVDEAEGDAEGVDNRGDAYGKMMHMAKILHERDPSRTIAQHFARVYVDPTNVDLAKAERMQSMAKLYR